VSHTPFACDILHPAGAPAAEALRRKVDERAQEIQKLGRTVKHWYENRSEEAATVVVSDVVKD
jgi:hypothetical protein